MYKGCFDSIKGLTVVFRLDSEINSKHPPNIKEVSKESKISKSSLVNNKKFINAPKEEE